MSLNSVPPPPVCCSLGPHRLSLEQTASLLTGHVPFQHILKWKPDHDIPHLKHFNVFLFIANKQYFPSFSHWNITCWFSHIHTPCVLLFAYYFFLSQLKTGYFLFSLSCILSNLRFDDVIWFYLFISHIRIYKIFKCLWEYNITTSGRCPTFWET